MKTQNMNIENIEQSDVQELFASITKETAQEIYNEIDRIGWETEDDNLNAVCTRIMWEIEEIYDFVEIQ